MKVEIKGRDAIAATEELLKIEGLQGGYQTLAAVEREGTLVTSATIVGTVCWYRHTIRSPMMKAKNSWPQRAELKMNVTHALLISSLGKLWCYPMNQKPRLLAAGISANMRIWASFWMVIQGRSISWTAVGDLVATTGAITNQTNPYNGK
jgi:hypothetical protein